MVGTEQKSLFKILEEHKNFVIFENIFGTPILYEKIMGTIHDLSDGNSGLVDILRTENRPFHFVSNAEYLEKDLSGEGWEDLILEVTENCNLRCGYCLFSGLYQGERLHAEKFQPKNMSIETALKALKYYAPHAKEGGHISFFGGEPFLNMPLIQAVMDECKNGLLPDASFNFTTNALLAYKNAQWLVDNNIYLAISLDGPQSIHDFFRVTETGQGSFEFVKRAVDRLREISPEYADRIVFTTTISHPAKIDEVKKFFTTEFPKNELIISGVEGRYIREQLSTHSPEDIFIMGKKLTDMALEYVMTRRQGTEPSDLDTFSRGYFHRLEWRARERPVGPINDNGNVPLFGACTPGKRKMYVTVNGEIYPCERIGGHMQIGDVDSGLDLTLINERIQQYTGYRNDVCGDCWAIRACDHCYTASKGGDTDGTGLSLESTKLYCPTAKDATLIGLSLMSAIDGGK